MFALINITDPVILSESLPITTFSNKLLKDTVYTMYLEYTTGSSGSSGGPIQMHVYPLIVELRSITADYYHYLQSFYLYERSLYNNNIGEIYAPYPIYSNVPEGYGIVGAYSSFICDTVFPE
jgi:hypothetical protein